MLWKEAPSKPYYIVHCGAELNRDVNILIVAEYIKEFNVSHFLNS